MRLLRHVALIACFLPLPAAAEALVVESRQIPYFHVASGNATFGNLTYVGGLVMDSDNSLFGSLSSIRFRPDGRHFVGVLDTGHWITGAIERDGEGRLSGLSEVDITSMVGANGRADQDKWRVDAEGLALRDGKAIVSFEQMHRIDAYPDPGFETSPPVGSIAFPIPVRELRRNGGFETLVVAPKDSPLKGGLLVIAEKSVDDAGNMLAAILDGPRKGQFTVKRSDRYDITDGAFLPDGDLLLLERRFELSTGLGMRIRRINGADIRPGAVIDGEILMEAGLGYQIDNMEGLDVIEAEDGSTRLIVTSDDNHSMLERNLMLEFRLSEPHPGSATNENVAPPKGSATQ